MATNNHGIAKAINGIMIYCALSAANTDIYISSRMMYGIGHHLRQATDRHHNLGDRWLIQKMEYVTKKGVPKWSVYFSALFFASWLTFTQVRPSTSANEVRWTYD